MRHNTTVARKRDQMEPAYPAGTCFERQTSAACFFVEPCWLFCRCTCANSALCLLSTADACELLETGTTMPTEQS